MARKKKEIKNVEKPQQPAPAAQKKGSQLKMPKATKKNEYLIDTEQINLHFDLIINPDEYVQKLSQELD